MNGVSVGAAFALAIAVGLLRSGPWSMPGPSARIGGPGGGTTRGAAGVTTGGRTRRLVGRWQRRGRTAANRAAVIEIIRSLAGELRAGAPAPLALLRSADSPPGRRLLRRSLAAARFGGSIPVALRDDGAAGGVPVLGSLAALWEVGDQSGAGMAAAAERLAASAASAEAIRHEMAGQLAGPRASARVLAFLPVVGVFLGSSLGASPIAWMLGSPVGLVVLLAGIGLEVLGLWWVSRLMRSVESLL